MAAAGIDPVGNALGVDRKVPGDAPEVGAVHIEFERLTAHRSVIAVRFGFGRIGASAVAALAAQGAGGVFAGTMLFGGGSTGRAGQRRFGRRLGDWIRHTLIIAQNTRRCKLGTPLT